jgi:hypothetical protein
MAYEQNTGIYMIAMARYAWKYFYIAKLPKHPLFYIIQYICLVCEKILHSPFHILLNMSNSTPTKPASKSSNSEFYLQISNLYLCLTYKPK